MQSELTPAVPEDVRRRIFEAADRLYNENGKARHPTVSDVRRIAKTDMNAASAVMRDWKHQQTARPESVAVSLPEELLSAAKQHIGAMWAHAQQLANQSLENAQAAWAIERKEAEELRFEISNNFDAQASELEALQVDLAALSAAHTDALSQLKDKTDYANSESNRADKNEVRSDALSKRVDELKAENENVKAELKEARLYHASEINEVKTVAAHDVDAVRAELHESVGRATALHGVQEAKIIELSDTAEKYRQASEDAQRELERAAHKIAVIEKALEAAKAQHDLSSQKAAEAMEKSAHLAGKVEALSAQCEALTARLGSKKA